jgi:hypothetical protein
VGRDQVEFGRHRLTDGAVAYAFIGQHLDKFAAVVAVQLQFRLRQQADPRTIAADKADIAEQRRAPFPATVTGKDGGTYPATVQPPPPPPPPTDAETRAKKADAFQSACTRLAGATRDLLRYMADSPSADSALIALAILGNADTARTALDELYDWVDSVRTQAAGS